MLQEVGRVLLVGPTEAQVVAVGTTIMGIAGQAPLLADSTSCVAVVVT